MSIEVKGDFIARDSESGATIVVQKEYKDRMLLLLLEYLFQLRVFKDGSAVSTWLKSTNLPHKFNYYA